MALSQKEQKMRNILFHPENLNFEEKEVELKMDSEKARKNDVARALIGASYVQYRSNETTSIEIKNEDLQRIKHGIGKGKLPNFVEVG